MTCIIPKLTVACGVVLVEVTPRRRPCGSHTSSPPICRAPWKGRGDIRRALSRRAAIFAALPARFRQFRKNTPLTFRGINAILALLFVWGAMPLNEKEVEHGD